MWRIAFASIFAVTDRAMDATMSRLFRAARDNAGDILASAAASAYFLCFLDAVHAALGKL